MSTLAKRKIPGATRGYATEAKPKKVGLIGARGFTGSNLVNLINQHPNLELAHVSSRELAGKQLDSYTKSKVMYENLSVEDVKAMEKSGAVDAWVMALPNGICKPFVDAIDSAGPEQKSVIVDLSADYRFEDDWVYGMPELYGRDKLRTAKRISNPGCYSTNSQMLIAPLINYVDPVNPPTVFGISGYSGGGTKSGNTPKIDPTSLEGAVKPYALTDHIHEREASRHLSTLAKEGFKIAFTPVVAPWFQGIISTASIPLTQELRASEVRELFEKKYEGERLVELLKDVPKISDIAGQHGFKAGGFQVHSSGKRVVVVGVIDNLLKGAATQCLQNLNIALGLDEYAGILDV